MATITNIYVVAFYCSNIAVLAFSGISYRRLACLIYLIKGLDQGLFIKNYVLHIRRLSCLNN